MLTLIGLGLKVFGPGLGTMLVKFLVSLGWKQERAEDLLARAKVAKSKTKDSALPRDREAEQLKELEEKLHPKPPTT